MRMMRRRMEKGRRIWSSINGVMELFFENMRLCVCVFMCVCLFITLYGLPLFYRGTLAKAPKIN